MIYISFVLMMLAGVIAGLIARSYSEVALFLIIIGLSYFAGAIQ